MLVVLAYSYLSMFAEFLTALAGATSSASTERYISSTNAANDIEYGREVFCFCCGMQSFLGC